MADKGYVRIHRKIWDNPLFKSIERYDSRSAWLWLICNANYKDGVFWKGQRVFHIQRGQLFTSVRFLAEKWRWDKKTVERFLRDMETEKMITRTGTQDGTLITIVNYSKYQASGDSQTKNRDAEGDTEGDTKRGHLGVTKGDTTKEEYKEEYKRNQKEKREGRVIE